MSESPERAFDRKGYRIERNAVPSDVLEKLTSAIDGARDRTGGGIRRGDLFGLRNLLRTVPEVRAFASTAPVSRIVHSILGIEARAVRGLFLDKTRLANWRLGWHRDLAIAVKRRTEVPGFRGWSVKEGVPHTLAPTEVLARMLTIRLHLDAADEGNGALKVIPGTHGDRYVNEQCFERLSNAAGVEVCEVNAGDIVVMSPLLVHCSEKCLSPDHRRVIHVEYSAGELPPPLEWNETVPIQAGPIRSGR